MAYYLIKDETLSNIADAIRSKTGEAGSITVKNMATEIESISPSLQTKTVTPTTSEQIVVADSGYDGLSQVTVNSIPSAYVKPTSTQAATTYTPKTFNQVISSGTYCSGAQTIKGDANLIAGNIKSGTSIFGVTGSYKDSTPIEISTDAGMEAVLTSENVGKIYKFTGTSGTYTNGDLYVVEVS